jgi:tetratricopeptide (TPR) repeat protein
MIRMLPARTAATTLALWLLAACPALAWHSLVERVNDGPAAASIRESYGLFEQAEASDDEATKLALYSRGRVLAEQAIKQDDRSPEAHFALFANWGRWLQTDGWIKNSFRLPALWKELDRTLEIDPDHPDALAAKGGLYLELPSFLGGDVEKARGFLERAVALDPDAVGARLELAECYIEDDRKEEARDLVDIAHRIAVEQGKARFVRRASELLRRLGPPPPHEEAKS